MNRDCKLESLLTKRTTQGGLRVLSNKKGLVDFSSNDYLGLARSEELKQQILASYQKSKLTNGSTGSRLLTGNNTLTKACEDQLSELFGYDSATVFNSGYMANLAFFSSVPQRGDTIIYDEYAHACIKDGSRLSMAKRLPFKHNDLDDLERKMKDAEGQVYIVCESVYSMDGDFAPLKDITKMAAQENARVVVDEAHSTGIWGKYGAGLVSKLKLQKQIFAVVHTFGKAMGIHGASISGSQTLKQFIVNYSRPFIYTTAPSPFEIISIQSAFEYLKNRPGLSLDLMSKIESFNRMTPGLQSPSPIKSVIIGGNKKTRQLATELQEKGLDVRPILSPTVKEGSERLRICLHTYNSDEEIALICDLLKKARG